MKQSCRWELMLQESQTYVTGNPVKSVKLESRCAVLLKDHQVQSLTMQVSGSPCMLLKSPGIQQRQKGTGVNEIQKYHTIPSK